jgi:hypothetical protein
MVYYLSNSLLKIFVMQKLLLLPLCVLLLISCRTNRSVYKSSGFDEKSSIVKTVAVLPFNIVSTGYREKTVSDADIKNANEKLGYNFQESLFNFLLETNGKKKKAPVTSFQPLQTTLAILAASKLDVATMYSKRPEELTRLLGVDAIVMTTLETHKNMSDGAAYGVYAARAILTQTNVGGAPLFGISAGNIKMNSYLYANGGSELFWKTFRQGNNELPSNQQGQIEFFTFWIAKKFPFKS